MQLNLWDSGLVLVVFVLSEICISYDFLMHSFKISIARREKLEEFTLKMKNDKEIVDW